MGSARDQLLFREMFHSCAQMPEFWVDDFGKEYEWKDADSNTWNNYIIGNTGREDVDWAMKQLKKEGWLHHLSKTFSSRLSYTRCLRNIMGRGDEMV